MELGLQVAAVDAGLVAILCGIVAAAAWRAMLRTGNRGITFVIAAFALLGVKNLTKSLNLASGNRESPLLEFVFSLVDLVAVGLIAWPLLMRRGPA